MQTGQLTFHSRDLQKFMEVLLYETYWCEKHLCHVLDNIKTKACTDSLREALIGHAEETRNQIGRLEKIYSLLGLNKEELFCLGMRGLLDETRQVLEETSEGSAHRDAALTIALQRIKLYEITSYESLHSIAAKLTYKDVTDLLEMSLAEEKKSKYTLRRLALNLINIDTTFESSLPTR